MKATSVRARFLQFSAGGFAALCGEALLLRVSPGNAEKDLNGSAPHNLINGEL